MLSTQVKDALREAVRRAGSQTALSQKTGMAQSQISDYCRGRFTVENISIGVLNRLFPDMQIDFFGEYFNRESGRHNTVEAGGEISGVVMQNVSSGGIRDVVLRSRRRDTSPPAAEGDTLDRRELERKIRKSATLSLEERLKFLDFLDDEL